MFLVAAKQNFATKIRSQESLENELKAWSGGKNKCNNQFNYNVFLDEIFLLIFFMKLKILNCKVIYCICK